MEKPESTKKEHSQDDSTENETAELSENKNDENRDNDALPSSTEKSQTTQKSVTICETRIEISDTEDEFENANVKSTPKITISEPVSSPNEYDNGDKEKQEVKEQCPIYYGIKSYIHDFYQPPDKEMLKSGEYIQEDDFQFLVTPGRRRKRCWLRAGMWLGVNLIVLGIIAWLVGVLTPPRTTVVGHQGSYDILDRWAVNFNERLVICQFAGLAGIMSGFVLSIFTFTIAGLTQDHKRTYYVMAATVLPETFVGNPLAGPRQGWDTHRIPLTGSVRGVQPTFYQTN